MIHQDAKVVAGSTIAWKGDWTESLHQKEGNGFIVTGKIVHKRSHNVNVSGKKTFPTNFIALTLELTDDIVKRAFDKGVEIAPQVQNERSAIKGYLTVERSKGKIVDILTVEEFAKVISGDTRKVVPNGYLSEDYLKNLYPHKPNVLEFWADRVKFQKVETSPGKEIRLKTLGDSIFVHSMTSINQQNKFLYNFSGDIDDVGDSWTSKITSNATQPGQSKKEDEGDDEWD